MSAIKIAQQGVRQRGFPFVTGTIIMHPGELLTLTPEVGGLDDFIIPNGCIRIVHCELNSFTTISIIRDDCKAARKAIRLVEASTDSLV
jgi:hypothetical protein